MTEKLRNEYDRLLKESKRILDERDKLQKRVDWMRSADYILTVVRPLVTPAFLDDLARMLKPLTSDRG
jgi:Dynamin GTPase effector domain